MFDLAACFGRQSSSFLLVVMTSVLKTFGTWTHSGMLKWRSSPCSLLGLNDRKRKYQHRGLTSVRRLQDFGSSASVDSGSSLIADLNPRMPSPSPLPSSGSFLGPNTNSAIPTITNRCMG